MTNLTHNQKVEIRKEMIQEIKKATTVQDREAFKKVLRRISVTPRFEVVLNCEHYYFGKCVKIKEDGITIIEIAKDDRFGDVLVDFQDSIIQTEKERERALLEESAFERQEESAFERYLDYKMSFDDPRGF